MLYRLLTVPPGYERRDIQTRFLIARKDVAEPLARGIHEHGALIEFAAQVPGARPMQGRQTAYAVTLAGGTRIVVRRNHHGGAFRKWTGSMFLWPTRAPQELAISLRLRDMGIPTPAVLGIGIYPDGILATSDVATEEIEGGQDFGELLLSTAPESEDRRKAWSAVEQLLVQLRAGGIRHHDLNVKNIIVRRRADDVFEAYLLDVDRVKMELTPSQADAGNRGRLRRSIIKWRDTRGAKISDGEIG